jgi:urease accessory protein
MAFGFVLAMAGVHLPFVEPAILASVVALGILVALAVDLPVWAGAAIIGAFALFHGHAHGSEVAENIAGFEYMAGFALATASLHALGIGFANFATRHSLRPLVRVAGAVCVVVGAGLYAGVI